MTTQVLVWSAFLFCLATAIGMVSQTFKKKK